MADPKLHHFVPQFYLRRFASDADRVAVRHRVRGAHVASVRNTAAENGLYRVPNRLLTAEYTFGDFESAAGPAFEDLSEGRLPPSGSSERAALALFMGLQLNRTPSSLAIVRFVYDARRALGHGPVSDEAMCEHLTALYGFEPEEPEVGAAADFANAAVDDSRTEEEIQEHHAEMMFRMALQTAPLLEMRSWSLEASRESTLITSDRPVVLWNPERPEDHYMGVGLGDAEELWFMVDPSRMLVLRRHGAERVKRIGPDRVSFVNRHVARHCSEAVVGHPDRAAELGDLPLSRRRPIIRFWRGPLANSNEGSDEVLHAWIPIRDLEAH